MAQIFTVLIIIVWIILAPAAWADSALDEAASKANIIVLKDDVEKAKKKLEGLTGTAYDEQLEKVKKLEENLAGAVMPASKKPPTDLVESSRQLLRKKRIVDELTVKKNSKEGDERQSVQEELDLAESDLRNSIKEASEQDKLQKLQLEADERFARWGFGVAIGVVAKAGSRDVIQSATLDPNGIVRVDRDANTTANLLLEGHYFFTPEKRFLPWAFDVAPRNWGHGPFVAIQPGTQNIIESIGTGWMFGFKRSSLIAKDTAPGRGDSFNLGFGIMVNPNAQVLGDGIIKNQVLPAGETAVRLKSTTELGWLFVFSYTF
ncbi:MAG: hypothetical protein AABY96_08495 [Nitrospirota bacterium]